MPHHFATKDYVMEAVLVVTIFSDGQTETNKLDKYEIEKALRKQNSLPKSL